MVNLYRILGARKSTPEYIKRESMIKRLHGKASFTDADLKEIMEYRKITPHSNQSTAKYTEMAFKAGDLDEKVRTLKKLNGVGIALASTILMMQNPNRYAELSAEAWNVLQRNYGLGGTEKSASSDYSVNEYKKYVEVVKSLSDEYGMKLSDVSYVLGVLKTNE